MNEIIRKQYRDMEILNVEYVKVAETEEPIYVYRRELKVFRGNSKKCKVRVDEGVCPESKLRWLRTNPATTPYSFMHYTGFEEMRRFGYALQHAPAGQRYASPFISETPFAHFENGTLAEYMLVYFHYDCGVMTFSESLEEVVPTGILMGYSEGKMNSANYNLGAAQKYLADRDDIFDLQRLPTPLHSYESGGEYLHFIWGPNYEDCQRVYAEARKSPHFKRHNGYLTSCIHKAIWDIDALGLKKAGCVVGYADRDFYTSGIVNARPRTEDFDEYDTYY